MDERRPTVLIVDPDATSAAALGGRIAALGFDVAAVARTADEARALTIARGPAVVVTTIPVDASAPDAPSLPPFPQPRPIPTVRIVTTDEPPPARVEELDYVVAPFTDRELRAVIALALSRENAEREVRTLENRFFALSVDLLCYLDFRGYFKRLNPAWERTLGFTIEELTSRPFIEFVHPDDRERTLAQNRAVRQGGQALAFENRYRCKDGSYRWFLWNATPDLHERVIYSVARDVTARKQAEEERERLLDELQSARTQIESLEDILPICSYCRRIRDDENFWHSVESYFARHTKTRFSHGICPSCLEKATRDLGTARGS